MKKAVLVLGIAIAGLATITGCSKNQQYVTTINPSMTADIGGYKFVASSVRPATIDTQVFDSSTTLIITGYTSDKANPYDKIVLSIANYKGLTGTFSIVAGQAGATFYNGASIGRALGGIVAVTAINDNTITGYFNFNTDDGITLTNGKFVVGKP